MWGEEIKYPFEFGGFIINSKDANGICKNCGKEVGRGVIPFAVHFNECAGKGLVDILKQVYSEKGTVTQNDIDEIVPHLLEKNKL